MHRLSRFAGVTLLTVSLLGVGATQQAARADDAAYCSTLQNLAVSGGLLITIASGESPTSAAAKVERIRVNYSKLRKVAPVEIAPDLTRMVATLARLRSDYLALRRATATKANGLRSQIQTRVQQFQDDSDMIEEDAIVRCNAELTDGDGSIAVSPSPSATPTPAPTPSTSVLLNGTGVYEIGKDIAPGPWTTRGGPSCEAGTSDDPTGADPTMGFVSPIGTGVATVMVTSAYKYFITRNCAGWRAGTLA
jgi:hypothetical protein